MLRIGIVGIGQQGAFYTKLFNGVEVKPGLILPNVIGAKVAAICDANQETLDKMSASFPHLKTFADYDAMLDSNELDAVIVASPHYFHPEMAIAALKRDLHVLVDKPAGVYTNQVQTMNAFAATKPHLKFAMMFNQRTNPLYQKLKALIEEDVIGNIRYNDWTITNWWRPQAYYDLSAWRATWAGEGGGVLINQAPHQIDLWQWICGKPSSIYAKAGYGSQRNIAVEDDVVAMTTYDNGATGIFRTCTHDMMGTDRFEILGDKGKIVVENSFKIILQTLPKSENEISDATTKEDVANLFAGVTSEKDFVTNEVFEFESIWGQQHFDVIQNFVDAINDDVPLIANGAEGIDALEITNAMHLSSWLGKEITLPIDADLFEAELNKRIEAENE